MTSVLVDILSDNWDRFLKIQMEFRSLANDIMKLEKLNIHNKHEIMEGWKMIDEGIETWLTVTSNVRDTDRKSTLCR